MDVVFDRPGILTVASETDKLGELMLQYYLGRVFIKLTLGLLFGSKLKCREDSVSAFILQTR